MAWRRVARRSPELVVDRAPSALPGGSGQLLFRRGDSRDRGAEHGSELDGGQAHPSPGAEDDELLARLQGGDRAEHVKGRPMGHAQGGGRALVEAGWDRGQSGGGYDDLLGEGAHECRAEDPIPGRQPLDVGCHLAHHSGELAPGDERGGDPQLVVVGHQQDVGEVDGGGVHAHPHLARPHLWCRYVGHADDLGWTVGAADGGAHVAVSDPARPAIASR